MPRLLATSAIALVLTAAAPALAQNAEPAPNTPATAGQPAPLTAAGREFATEVARGGLAEVQLGRLAQEKAESAEVKELAGTIASEHDRANQELAAIAGPKGIELPTQLDAQHKAMHDELVGLSGAEFDREYVAGMVEAHDKAIPLFERQALSGEDPELQAFAAATLPKIQAHADRLDALAQQMEGQPAQQATAPTATGTMAAVAPAAGPATEGEMTGATSSGGMLADDLVELHAFTAEGERMGEVEDVIVDPADGRVVAALIEFGGFLGLGSKRVAVDWADLRVDPADERIVVELTREELQNAPIYEGADD